MGLTYMHGLLTITNNMHEDVKTHLDSRGTPWTLRFGPHFGGPDLVPENVFFSIRETIT